MPFLTQALTAACAHFQVHVTVCEGRESSFLGRGRDGFVFSVHDPTVVPLQPLAMKIVLAGDIAKEFSLMLQVFNTAQDLIVKPMGAPFVSQLSDGSRCGAYLMATVGKQLSGANSGLFMEALSNLHRLGFVHGDPRLPNALLIDNKCKFIDLRQVGHGLSATPQGFIEDVKIFFRSLLGHSPQLEDNFENEDVKQLLNAYGAGPTEKGLMKIRRALINLRQVVVLP